MGIWSESAGPRNVRRWRPFVVLALGALITFLLASLQSDAAGREQDLLFERASVNAVAELEAAVAYRTDEFLSSVNFVHATHPAPVEEYERFFNQEAEFSEAVSIDPGVFFVEAVETADIAALEARERALGHDDFSVVSFGRPPDSPHLVITRTGRQVEVGGLSVRGMDMSTLYAASFSSALPEEGFVLSAHTSDSMLGMFFAPDLADQIGQALSPVILSITGAVDSSVPGEPPIGWSIRFFSADLLTDSLSEAVSKDLYVRVSAADVGELITRPAGDGAPLDWAEADHSTQQQLDTQGLQWTVDVWSDHDFGVAAGLFDQRTIWLVGLSISLVTALGLLWRDRHRGALEATEFELEHARTLASTDGLTGLLNRQGLMSAIDRTVPNQPATVFFVDLDGFKAINDTLGHAAGDTVLRNVAEALRETFRSRDIIGRYGGDEFLVYVSGVSSPDVVAESSRRLIEAIAQLDGDFTGSVGVATRLAGEQVDNTDLIRSADRAMYRAKHTGGGRFELALTT